MQEKRSYCSPNSKIRGSLKTAAVYLTSNVRTTVRKTREIHFLTYPLLEPRPRSALVQIEDLPIDECSLRWSLMSVGLSPARLESCLSSSGLGVSRSRRQRVPMTVPKPQASGAKGTGYGPAHVAYVRVLIRHSNTKNNKATCK